MTSEVSLFFRNDAICEKADDGRQRGTLPRRRTYPPEVFGELQELVDEDAPLDVSPRIDRRLKLLHSRAS